MEQSTVLGRGLPSLKKGLSGPRLQSEEALLLAALLAAVLSELPLLLLPSPPLAALPAGAARELLLLLAALLGGSRLLAAPTRLPAELDLRPRATLTACAMAAGALRAPKKRRCRLLLALMRSAASRPASPSSAASSWASRACREGALLPSAEDAALRVDLLREREADSRNGRSSSSSRRRERGTAM
jgi:hypothetical protein